MGIKIDFSQPLKDFDGLPITEGSEGEPCPHCGRKPEPKREVTLRDVCKTVLLNILHDEKIDGNARFEFGQLAELIHRAKEPVDLKTEKIALLKERIGKVYFPLYTLAAWRLLEGESENPMKASTDGPQS